MLNYRKGMDLYDLEVIVHRRRFFLRIVELILDFQGSLTENLLPESLSIPP